ncbi:MAG: transglutaminase domain-containing protein [Thermotogae bacterium]|nr:transglutaminase domain-containing protein [Thermotogota bacterium]
MLRLLFIIGLLTACGGMKEDKREVSKRQPDFHFVGSVYMLGKRAGWEEMEAYKVEDGWEFNERMYIKVIMLGLVKEMRTEVRAKVKGDGGIRRLRFFMSTQDATVEAVGEVKDRKFYVTYKPAKGGPQRFNYELVGPLLTPQTFVFAAAVGLLEDGTYSYFDPSVASFMEAKVKKESDTLWTLNVQGIIVRAHVKDGKLLLQNQPLKMDIVAQPPQKAKAPVEPFNVLSLYAVRPKGVPIGDLKTLERLVLRLYPISGNLVLDFANQKVLESRGDTFTVEITYPKELKASSSPPPESLRKYLEPTQFLEVDDPQIKELASKITQGKKTDLEKARAIANWVYTNLEKRGSVTIPTAKQVLKEMYGDCNEHATLYAALARAAGIPTDIVVGLVYQGDGFYYHAWNVSWIGGQWVPVDPVYGEFPARPYRITLQHGSLEKQATIMAVIGNLNIEILKAEHSR